MNASSPFIFLPGAGANGEEGPGADVLKDGTPFEVIKYPGWQRYVEPGFSAQALIDEIAATIVSLVPTGAIRIVGMSLGGHFGYAAALRLQAQGREVAGFCAIDSFMISSPSASEGWQRRAIAEAIALVRKGRVSEIVRFVRSKFWRALIRTGGGRVAGVLRKMSRLDSNSSLSKVDRVLESELSMRLLIREAAPWIPSLDHSPAPLSVPTALIRTQLTRQDDEIWRKRCPRIEIHEVSGNHHTLFEPENIGALRRSFVSATSSWV